jgi:tetratricopeptide (TPR) repeat protein
MKLEGIGAYLAALGKATQKALRKTQVELCNEVVGIAPATWKKCTENKSHLSETDLFGALEAISQELAKMSKVDAVRGEVAILLEAVRDRLTFRSGIDEPQRDPLTAAHQQELVQISQLWALGEDDQFESHIVQTCINRAAWFFRRFEFDRALLPLEAAERLAPHNFLVQLWVAKTHLHLPKTLANWIKAFHILTQPVPANFSHWAEWQAKLGIVWFRHPDEGQHLPEAEACLRCAVDGGEGVHAMEVAQWKNDLAVTLFRSEDPEKFPAAVKLFEESRAIWEKYECWREWASATKRLANFSWMSARGAALEAAIGRKLMDMSSFFADPTALAPEAKRFLHVQCSAALSRAFELYQAARDKFADLDLPMERANVEYSWADAEFHLAIFSDVPKQRYQRLENAISLCHHALESLTVDQGEDYGNATWNLAEACVAIASHKSEESGELPIWENAVSAYRETLRAFPKHYREFEWSDTHFKLSKALWRQRGVSSDNKAKTELARLAVASAKAAMTVSITSHPKVKVYSAWERELFKALEQPKWYGEVEASRIGVSPLSREELRERLLSELSLRGWRLVEELRQAKSAEYQQVQADLKIVVDEATHYPANRRWYVAAGTGLVEAAHSAAVFDQRIPHLVREVGTICWDDFELPI